MNKKRIILSLIINFLIFIPTIIVVIHGILYGVVGAQPGDNVIGLGYFKPYTMDSNILAVISSLFIIIFNIGNLINKNNKIHKWGLVLHLMSTTCLVLTFLVTLLFLTPMFFLNGDSLFIMYKDELILLHLFNPILSFISFVYLSKDYNYKYRDVLLGCIPTLIYSIIYLLMVIVFKKWDDFYNFTLGGKYYLVPFVFILINFITYIISLFLTKIKIRN